MSKYGPYVYVIPEDDANRQIANGFVLHHGVDSRRIQVMPEAGGWPHVLDTFQDEYIQALRMNPQACVVMLIDFDDSIDKLRAIFEKAIPVELKERVFVVGSKHEPEVLRQALSRTYEKIGLSLADDCDRGSVEHWNHEQLHHNEVERQRMIQSVRPLMF